MCYYDQYRMACGDGKWGNFRQHCSREYRTGETCGTKMVNATIQMQDICKICAKIDTKKGRIQKERERIRRWTKEGNRRASIESAEDSIAILEREVYDLEYQRQYKAHDLR